MLVRKAEVFQKLGAATFYSPGRFHGNSFAYGRSLGGHQQEWEAEQPTVFHMLAAPGSEVNSGTGIERCLAGRHRLLAMSFTDYEREVRVHLADMLAGGGFDAARDILAITVNRWPHGYSYARDPLYDPEWAEGEAPNEIGRQRFGRIAIANSDAGWHAYVDGAIDQAHRAVTELVQSDSASKSKVS